MHGMWRCDPFTVANAAAAAWPRAPLVDVWVAIADGVVAWISSVVVGESTRAGVHGPGGADGGIDPCCWSSELCMAHLCAHEAIATKASIRAVPHCGATVDHHSCTRGGCDDCHFQRADVWRVYDSVCFR